MVSMLMSNFMMFLPETTKCFCLIGMFIAFWLYVKYEEHKKKKKQQQKYRQQNPEPAKQTPEDRRKLEQLKALKNAGMLSEEEYQEKKKELRQQ